MNLTNFTMQAESNVGDGLFVDGPKPASSVKVCVIVPVRNEAEHLRQTLDALRLQVDDFDRPLPFSSYEVLVLVNNCTDHSFSIASDYRDEYPDFRLIADEICLPDDIAHIGTVRRLLMDEAYDRLTLTGNQRGIIASIDGDTVADKQWLHYIINEIALGNDAVGGRILANEKAGNAHLHYLRDITYRCLLTQAESMIDPQDFDPLPRHFQYFGANMAVTCDMYAKAGRLPQVSCLEDMAFHRALIRHDAKIRRSFKVKVYTSARLDGRVSIGFSEQLKRWTSEEAADVPQLVEHVDESLSAFVNRERLRRCWIKRQSGCYFEEDVADLAADLKIDLAWLSDAVNGYNYFGELWEAVYNQYRNSENASTVQLQPIRLAIEQLRNFVYNNEAIIFQKDLSDKYLRAG